MIVAAMTAHGDVVTWCVAHTAARPWVVAKAMVCFHCCVAGSCALSHMCEVEDHMPEDGWDTAAVLAACWAGDAALLRRLMREHVECDAGVRRCTLVDDVSVCCMGLVDVCGCGRMACACVGAVARTAAGQRCCGRVPPVTSWLVTDAGGDARSGWDARSERDDVSCRCSCRRLYVSLLYRERCGFVLGGTL
jgi:hypothetical protein